MYTEVCVCVVCVFKIYTETILPSDFSIHRTHKKNFSALTLKSDKRMTATKTHWKS